MREDRHTAKQRAQDTAQHTYPVVEEDHHEAKAEEAEAGHQQEPGLGGEVDLGLARKDRDAHCDDARDAKRPEHLGVRWIYICIGMYVCIY